MSVVEKEDWKSVIGLVTNAKQVVSSVQDVARKLADYAKFLSKKNSAGKPTLLGPKYCQNVIFLKLSQLYFYGWSYDDLVIFLNKNAVFWYSPLCFNG